MGMHPLDRLTVDEFNQARELLLDNGLLTASTAIALLALEEPAKDVVLAFRDGDASPDREVRAVLLDVTTGAADTVLISLTHKRIVSQVPIDPAVDGQPPIMLSEFIAA